MTGLKVSGLYYWDPEIHEPMGKDYEPYRLYCDLMLDEAFEAV